MSEPGHRDPTAPAHGGLESAVALAIAQARGISDAGEHVLGAIGASLGLRAGILWRFDEREEHLRVAAAWTAEPGADVLLEDSRRRAYASGEGLPGLVWESGRLLWLADVWSDDRYPRAPAARRAGLRTAIGIPLVARGELVGVAELLSAASLPPDPELSGMLEGMGGQIGQLLERVHADETIAASEARKAAILDAALDVVITADLDGRIVEANHAITDLLGWSVDEAVGASIAELIVPPELRRRHEDGLRRYAETGDRHVVGRRIEVDALHRDGTRIPIELTLTAVESPRLVTAFLRDLRERRRIEAEHSRLLEAEQAARASAESAWQRLRLVSDVSELLAATFDYPRVFHLLAERIVADIADLCLIDSVDSSGRVTRVSAKHRDPRMQPLADRLEREYAPEPHGLHPAAGVIRTARSRFSPFMSEEFLRSTCRDEEHYRLVTALGFQSYISVPLIARRRILGALTLVSTDPGRRYGQEDVAVAEEIGRRASVRIDNARLYRERDHVAHVLQQGLLPQELPTVPRLDITARYLPAGEGIEAGGDFYDVFPTGSDRWSLVIGDVCGKGPEAAARMGIARPALRALAHAHPRPARLLRALNDELLEHGKDFRFVTIAYVQALVGQKAGVKLTACLAGHPAGLLVTAGGNLREIGRPGTLLGIHRDVTLREHPARMEAGDTLLLYTDGLADEGPIAPADAAELGEIVTDYRTAPAAELVRHLEGLLDRSAAAGSHGRDDVAFMVVRCTG